jgi:hypothetical protein
MFSGSGWPSELKMIFVRLSFTLTALPNLQVTAQTGEYPRQFLILQQKRLCLIMNP